jgi:TPR repeat protein
MIKALRAKIALTGLVLGLAAFSSPALANIDFQSQKPEDQLEIGYAYYTGTKGLPNSHAEAAKWFRKAADNGNLRAINIMGVAVCEWQRGSTKRDRIRSMASQDCGTR